MPRPARRAPHDLDSASQALRKLASLRQALDDILRETEHQIQRIEAQARRRSAPLRRHARTLEHGLERFAAGHPELLGPGQRLDLPAGSLGFLLRHILRPLPGLAWAQIAERLAKENLPPSPASPAGVDPQALASLPPHRLHALGVAAAAQSTFWCHPAPLGGE